MSDCSQGVKIAGDFIGFSAKEIDDINERRDRLKTEKNQLDLQK